MSAAEEERNSWHDQLKQLAEENQQLKSDARKIEEVARQAKYNEFEEEKER